MTVTITTTTESFAGDGTVGQAFALTMAFWDDTDLLVYEVPAGSASVLLTMGVDYTVSGGAGASGTVTLAGTKTIAVGDTLRVTRNTSRTQQLDYQSQTAFPAASHEEGLDRAVMRDQEQDATTARSLRVGRDESSINELPDLSARANTLLGFDANGQPYGAAGQLTGVAVTNFVANNILNQNDATGVRDAISALRKDAADVSLGTSLTMKPAAGDASLILDPDAAQDTVYSKGSLVQGSSPSTQERLMLHKVRPSDAATLTLTWENQNPGVPADAAVDREEDEGALLHSGLFPARNLLINGTFEVWQLGDVIDATADGWGSTRNASQNVGPDMWRIFQQAVDTADFNRDAADPPSTGYGNACRVIQNVANKQWALCQLLERARTPQGMKRATLELQAKSPSGLVSAINVALVTWTPGGDAPNWANLVGAWGDINTFAVGVNWSMSTATQLTLTSAWKRYVVEGIAIDPTAGNVGVLIWIDDTTASAADEVKIADVALLPGGQARPYVRPFPEQEVLACQRHFCKTYDLDVAPGTVTNTSQLRGRVASAASVGGHANWRYPVQMRKTPTVVAFQTNALNTQGKWNDGSAATVDSQGEGGTAFTAGSGTTSLGIHGVADARM